ncbi:hypothetical protein MHSWG343_04050 [Candidatus Mycoplasma haematohominis]|uniref:Uncharacterized protein n=1 Tax=Candidatus Mycoplasma haematohominis TaxID=1494318 RepID=A0A478FSG9_9MOLU|nr:hypothetical protein MHSWG343_04050 [Candidatus Mycoplasma haemohominis]
MKASFIPKAGGALAVGGAFGGGGAVIYSKTTPKNWKEGLEWEGLSFIESIQDATHKQNAYKAVYISYQDSISADISAAASENAWQKIQQWCQQELQKPFKKLSVESEEERKKLIKYCEDTRPVTVEAHLQKLGTNKDLWIKNKTSGDKEEPYKTIFAVYRYHDTFLREINGTESVKYTNTTTSDVGYSRLKTWCESNLSKQTKDVENFEELYNHLSWWCQPLGYKTVVEKIQHDLPKWNKESSTETDDGKPWDKIKGYWQLTQEVFSVVKSDSTDGTKLTGQEYKTWCEENLKKNLYDSNVYQQTHLVAKVVCVEEKVQSKLFEFDLATAVEKVEEETRK